MAVILEMSFELYILDVCMFLRAHSIPSMVVGAKIFIWPDKFLLEGA